MRSTHDAEVWAGSQLELSVYLGVSWLAILVLGLAAMWLRRDPDLPRGRIVVHLLLGALFAWLALGPSLDPVLPLYRFLYDWMPYWNYGRVPGRMIYIPLCLGSIAFALTLTASARSARWAPGLAAAFVIWDLIVRAPALLLGHGIEPSPALAAIAALDVDPDGALLYLPIHPPGSSQAAVWELFTTQIRQPYLNGYSPAAPSEAHGVLRTLERLNAGEFDTETARVLADLRVRYLVYNTKISFLRPPAVVPDLVERLARNPRLAHVMHVVGWYVFERVDVNP